MVDWGHRIDDLQNMVSDDYIPAALERRPEPVLAHQPVLDAFYFLTSRLVSHFDAIGCIPLSEMISYTQVAGMNDPATREEFIFFLSFADNFYVGKINEKKAKSHG